MVFLKGIIKDRPDRVSAFIKNVDQRNSFIEKVKSIMPPDHQMDIDFIYYLSLISLRSMVEYLFLAWYI